MEYAEAFLFLLKKRAVKKTKIMTLVVENFCSVFMKPPCPPPAPRPPPPPRPLSPAPKAPFLGVLSAMRDTSLPLTVHEFDEWGDPSSSEAVEAMIRSYCPYENVRRQAYPALLVTASVNDTRCAAAVASGAKEAGVRGAGGRGGESS